MRNVRTFATAAAVASAVAVASSMANATSLPVVNPGFDDGISLPLPNTAGCGGANPLCSYNDGPISGWTSTGGQIGVQNLGILLTPKSDPVEAYVNGNGSMLSQSESFTSIAGDTYTLGVYVGNRSDGFNGPVTVELDVGSQTSLVANYFNPTANSWQFVSTSLVANASNENITIKLISDGTQGNFDSVTLSQTPLPAALPLFATGLGAMGLFGWRRKRRARLLT